MAKRRRGRGRRAIQLFFAAATNSYVTGFAAGSLYQGGLKQLCTPGLNCYSCPGAVLSCPIGSLQAVIGSQAFNISLYVLGLITMFGALLGRTVCGFLCPFGMIQEWLHKIPFPWKKNRFRGDKPLRKLKYLVLAVMVIVLPMVAVSESGAGTPAFCKYVCPAGTLEAGIPLVYFNSGGLRAAPAPAGQGGSSGLLKSVSIRPQAPVLKTGALFNWKLALLAAVVLLSVVNYRPFCKYICPLGAMYGLMNPLSLHRLRFAGDKCVACGACARACGMGLDPSKKANTAECVRCGDCVNACPTGALSLGFGEKKTPQPVKQPLPDGG